MYHWYVASTHHCQELVAKDDLRAKGFQPFLPMVSVTRMTRGRKVTTERPYLTNYIFINMDTEDPGWRRSVYCRGIKHVLSTSPECPTRIRPGAMQVILDKCTGEFVDGAAVDLTLSKFVPRGSKVRLTEGSFSGFVGPVTMSDGDRINVMLNLFGRDTEVKGIRTKDVELVV